MFKSIIPNSNIARRKFRIPNSKISENAATKRNVIKSKFKDVAIPNLVLHQHVWQNLDRWPQKTAVICGLTGRGYTYEQAFEMSNIFAASLRTKFKLTDGDTVAIILPNTPDYPLVLFGANEAGCVVTTVNPIYKPDEIQRQLTEANVKLIVTFAAKVPDIRKALSLAKLKIPIVVTKELNEDLPEGTILFSEIVEDRTIDKSCLKKVKNDPNEVAFLPYSSGTTGLPKGVELSNRNLVANMVQQSEEEIIYLEPDCQTTLLAVLPFFHIYAISATLCHKLSQGCRLVTLPTFNLQTSLECLHKYDCDGFHVVPPIVSALALHPLAKPEYFEKIKCIFNGAAPLVKSDCDTLHQKINRPEFKIRQGYGLTETSPVLTIQHPDDDDLDSCGLLVPNTELRIVGENGTDLGPNELGEVYVRGPQVMRGYRNNPKANSEIFDDDRWLKTGDSGKFDESGRLFISERIKELIKVKGYQVAPAELENVIKRHPSVADVAVVGVPDSKTGESPRAFVVLRPKSSCSSEDIMTFVEDKVASFKKLSSVTFIDAVPRVASGKILRKVIKDKYC